MKTNPVNLTPAPAPASWRWADLTAAEKCQRVAGICGLLTIGLALLALLSWGLWLVFHGRSLEALQEAVQAEPDKRPGREWLILARLLPNYSSLEMVPLTACNFLVLAGALILAVRPAASLEARRLARAVAALSIVWGLLGLGQNWPPVAGLLDGMGLQTLVRSSGMSPLTTVNQLLAGTALLLVTLPPRAAIRTAVVVCAAAVTFMTLLVVLGYAHDIQLFISRLGIPMAFPTALALGSLGVGLVAAAGPDTILVRPFTGRSARALLMRSFVPATLAVVLLSDVLRGYIFQQFYDGQPNDDLIQRQVVIMGLTAVLAALVVGVVVLQVARVVGWDLDQAEEARQRALEEMRQARDAAEDANRAKNRFLANMSHELRTPLNSVIGYSEMLMEEVEERGLVELLPDLRRIHDSGRHLLNLINDVLDLSKIAAGKVDLFPETFEVKPKLLDIVSTVRPLVEKNANTLTVQCPDNIGTMHTDFTRLKQCLLNLLSNAGKFTERGHVTLQVRRETADGQDWVLFDIIDTGIGLEPGQLKKIFKPFVQADSSTTRRFGGTGLGLTVSLSFCQLMGGTILVESAPGKGSTFTLKLPAVLRKTEKPARPLDVEPSTAFPSSGVTPADGRPKILVVDDDQSVQDMLGRLLNKEGYEVISVTRGEDVLPLARQLRPAAITLDVMMPGMDGWSVLSALKGDPELADIPVIMLTIVDDKNLGYALGAVDYLVKPVDHNRILSILRTHCRTDAHAGRSALVVEDDAAQREMLRRTLEGDGWTVTEASNGREALERVAARKPALILLDLMMPEMDGFEFLEELRQKPEWQAIPVVVVTARDLSAEDRMFLTGAMFLGGCVKRVLQKGMYRREDLLQEARALVTAQSGRASKGE